MVDIIGQRHSKPFLSTAAALLRGAFITSTAILTLGPVAALCRSGCSQERGTWY